MKRLIAITCVVLCVPRVCPAQSTEVQRLYQKARTDQQAGRDEAAVADYRELLRIDPTVAAAYNNLGRLFYNMGHFREAVETLRKGLELDPGMAPANVMLGAAYFQLGQMEAAVPPLQAGVGALPTDQFARMTLARALFALKRDADAAVQLNAVLTTDPKDQEAWYVLGKVHLRLSEEAFSEVQRIDANSALANVMSGEIMESMQNTPGAIDAYKKAIAAAPENASALDHLANVYWSTGDWARSREEFAALAKKQPGNCTAHWKLANSLNELGETPETGMAEVDRALELCPNLAQAHAERARLLLRMKRPTEALVDLRAAEKGAPDEPSVQRLFAQAYRAIGDPQRAAAADQHFQKLEAAEHAAKERRAASVSESNP